MAVYLYAKEHMKKLSQLGIYYKSMEDAKQCSKCEAALDAEGFPKWCKACRAKYRREYEATKKEMGETRGYAAGSSAMRNKLAGKFWQYPSAHFSGAEIASMILKEPDPGAERP